MSNKESVVIQITIPEDKKFEVLLRKNSENEQSSVKQIEEEVKYKKPEEPKKGIVKVLVEKFESNSSENTAK